MFFQYIGHGADSPEVTKAFGVRFVLNGEAMEVRDPEAIMKLKGNKTFILVESETLTDAEFVEVKKKPGRPKK